MRINTLPKMLKATCVSCYNAFQTSGHHVQYEAKMTNSQKELIQKGESFSLYRINYKELIGIVLTYMSLCIDFFL
jgi:hypothetical protein